MHVGNVHIFGTKMKIISSIVQPQYNKRALAILAMHHLVLNGVNIGDMFRTCALHRKNIANIIVASQCRWKILVVLPD